MLFHAAITLAAGLFSIALAAPTPKPISAATEAFAANCLMTAGSAQFAVWIPTDGTAYSTSSLTCLNIGSSSYGACNIASIDQVACVNGYTCAWSGSNGWSGSQVGTSITGWVQVAPPTTITAVIAVSN